MTTVYIKQNGTKVTVEVTEEIAEYLKHTRRQIWRNIIYSDVRCMYVGIVALYY